jgi:hypothetical protein
MPFPISPLAVAALALTVFAGAASGAAQERTEELFEGVVRYRAKDGSGSHVVSYAVSGDRVRLDVERPGEQSTMIVDADAEVLYVVLPARQMYMQLSIPPLRPPRDESAEESQPVRTGRTHTVAGHRCETWVIADGAGEIEMCVARDLGSMGALATSVDRRIADASWYRRLASDFFPLRVATRDVHGNEVSRLEATRVDRRPLDRSLFRPPPDYRKVLLPLPRGPQLR